MRKDHPKQPSPGPWDDFGRPLSARRARRDRDLLRTSLAIASSTSGHHRAVRNILSVHLPRAISLSLRARGNSPAGSARHGHVGGWPRSEPLLEAGSEHRPFSQNCEQPGLFARACCRPRGTMRVAKRLLRRILDFTDVARRGGDRPRTCSECARRTRDRHHRPRSPRPRHLQKPQREVRRRTRTGTHPRYLRTGPPPEEVHRPLFSAARARPRLHCHSAGNLPPSSVVPPGASVCPGEHGAPRGGTRAGLAPAPPQLLSGKWNLLPKICQKCPEGRVFSPYQDRFSGGSSTAPSVQIQPRSARTASSYIRARISRL